MADRFNEVPYLRILGAYGSGKSRFLDTMAMLCYKPILVASAFTEAVLFHLASLEGTIVADEADFIANSSMWKGIIKILNSGYQKRRAVVRMRESGRKGVENFEPMAYNTFGAKILAMRNDIKDTALKSRFLTIYSRAVDEDEEKIPVNLPNIFFIQRQELQNKLLLWKLENYKEIMLDIGLQSKLKMMEPRMKQIAIPLLSTVDDPIERAKLTHYFNEQAMELAEARKETLAYKVYSALKEFKDSNRIPVTVSDVAKRVNNSISDSNKHITAHKCGRIIREELGLQTIVDNVGDKKGYRFVMFTDEDLKKIGKRFGEY